MNKKRYGSESLQEQGKNAIDKINHKINIDMNIIPDQHDIYEDIYQDMDGSPVETEKVKQFMIFCQLLKQLDTMRDFDKKLILKILEVQDVGVSRLASELKVPNIYIYRACHRIARDYPAFVTILPKIKHKNEVYDWTYHGKYKKHEI
jgi:hypothetical protein